MSSAGPDPKILGQLLVMQNCIPLLDTEDKLLALVNRGLARIPGVVRATVALSREPSAQHPRTGRELELSIETLTMQFGRIELELCEGVPFDDYEPFVRNLAGAMALWLENRARQGDLETTLAKLDAALREREAFLAVVSHDLGNPLGAIMNVVQVLKDAPDLGAEKVTASAKLIERSATRMKRLIRDLLDLASIDAGQFSVHLDRCDLGPLLREALEEVRAVAAQKDIGLALELAPALPPVYCDASRVAQVMSNLLGNAVKFTAGGGRVVLSAVPADNRVRITVADDGPGIPREDVPHVFDRFYRSQQAREPGTGLGLAIAKAIVSLHGGQMELESPPGQGTRIGFTLPGGV